MYTCKSQEGGDEPQLSKQVIRSQSPEQTRAFAIKDEERIWAWDGDLTYAELDRLAGRLAAQLVELGVGPEVMVPLCFEKSRWTVAAMLAVLKAGGAFVLLDTSQPTARHKAIVQQIGSSLLLCSADDSSWCASLAMGVVQIGFDSSIFIFEHACLERTRQSETNPNSPFCVVFTSGSTGRPNGPLLHTRGLAPPFSISQR